MNPQSLYYGAKSILSNMYVLGPALGAIGGFKTGMKNFHVDFPADVVRKFQKDHTFTIPVSEVLLKEGFSVEHLNKLLREKFPAESVAENFNIKLRPELKVFEFEPTEAFAREMAITPGLMNDIILKIETVLTPTLANAITGGIFAALFTQGPKVINKMEEKLFGPEKTATLVKDEIESRITAYELKNSFKEFDSDSVLKRYL